MGAVPQKCETSSQKRIFPLGQKREGEYGVGGIREFIIVRVEFNKSSSHYYWYLEDIHSTAIMMFGFSKAPSMTTARNIMVIWKQCSRGKGVALETITKC